jgi:hypothetical protein
MELILSLSYLDVFFLWGERVREEGSRCLPIVRPNMGLRYSGLEAFLMKLFILLPRRDLSLSFTFIGNKFIRNIFRLLVFENTQMGWAVFFIIAVCDNYNFK